MKIGSDFMKFYKKLTLGSLSIVIFAILLLSLISNYKINKDFNIYLYEEYQNKINGIFLDLESKILEDDWPGLEESINYYSYVEDMDFEIFKNGNRLLSTRISMGRGMGSHRHMMGLNNKNNNKQAYTHQVLPYQIVIYGDDLSEASESAVLFKNTLKKSYLISGLASVVLAVGLSLNFSKAITKPLESIEDSTRRIAKGNLNPSPISDSNILELRSLRESILILRENLLKEEALREDYALNIAHELRTPLTTLSSYIEAMEDGLWPLDKSSLNILSEETKKLGTLVDNLHSSFLASGIETSLNKHDYSLKSQVISILENFQQIFTKENIIIDFKSDDFTVYWDRFKIDQVFYNLLSNSIQGLDSKDNKLIEISIEEQGPYAYINFKDNGKGIDKEDMDHIFNRFYRPKESSYSGSGLGLSIVKSHINSHGGSIDLESSLGSYTKFTIEIPKRIS